MRIVMERTAAAGQEKAGAAGAEQEKAGAVAQEKADQAGVDRGVAEARAAMTGQAWTETGVDPAARVVKVASQESGPHLEAPDRAAAASQGAVRVGSLP